MLRLLSPSLLDRQQAYIDLMANLYRARAHWAEFEVYDCGGFISWNGYVDVPFTCARSTKKGVFPSCRYFSYCWPQTEGWPQEGPMLAPSAA